MQDASQAVIPGALIVISNEDTGIEWKYATDVHGDYLAPSLPPGKYRVAVESQGFKKFVSTSNEVSIAQDTRVDITLPLGAVSETVTVEATAPLVQSTTSELGVLVEQKQIQDPPLNGRLFSQLVLLTPGTVPTGFGDAPETASGAGARSAIQSQVNGLPYSGSNYTINGVSNKEVMNAFIAMSPPVEALEQFQVQTSNPSAEFGAYSGAVVNLTIRSGTNRMHGSLFDYFRNDALNARKWEALTRPPLRSNQFGGTIGGPIVRNKAFYFFDYQGLRLDYPQSTNYNVPSALRRQGVFSASEGFGTIYDPMGNFAPLPNNTIPRARWDAVAAKAISLWGAAQSCAAELWNQRPGGQLFL